ncbi:hypothetical protein PSTG_10771 [Puccinia striiformis f. sp. tritici PST-78]|uniref:Uncharacterized protein n=1 Tax=Puccinia striiformis f. sp. tritici PST-78 TaxID=1165861 RepID=A0A0L0V999_9BASI|nr:hypothetical protein PSTG_10771 [Puccinia striiformis f. sp. tritici PST-78]
MPHFKHWHKSLIAFDESDDNFPLDMRTVIPLHKFMSGSAVLNTSICTHGQQLKPIGRSWPPQPTLGGSTHATLYLRSENLDLNHHHQHHSLCYPSLLKHIYPLNQTHLENLAWMTTPKSISGAAAQFKLGPEQENLYLIQTWWPKARATEFELADDSLGRRGPSLNRAAAPHMDLGAAI